MPETSSPETITGDCNFQQLAARTTKVEEFNELLEKNVCGYTQRKRLADGLKELSAKVEVIENKLYVMRSVGKAKSKLEDAEQEISDAYNGPDLKEKTSAVNALIQAMLDEGKFSAEEKPHILDNLRTRRDTAKAGNKEKLLEKLEKNLTTVIKSEGSDLPLVGLPEIAKLNTHLQYLLVLKKKASKDLKKPEAKELEGEADQLEKIKVLEQNGRWWFETDFELDNRVKKAIRVYAETEKERKIKEEEDAFEALKQKQERLVEEKRLEAIAKEKKIEEELNAKLTAARLAAAAKPQKEVPKAKPKPKKRVIKLDNKDLFQDSSVAQDFDFAPDERVEEYEENVDEPAAEEEHAEEEDVDVDELISKNVDPTEVEDVEVPVDEKPEDRIETSAPPAPAAVTAEPKASPKVAPKKAPPKEAVWKAPTSAETADDADAPETAEPSLADAAAAAKAAPKKDKTPAPQPKKKEKKKFAKIGAADLGFEC